MKLIIDIDEEIYESIKIGMRNRDDMTEIGEAVENGIPLDKIRAEIIDKYMTATGEVNTVAKGCLQIINKYKAESEE